MKSAQFYLFKNEINRRESSTKIKYIFNELESIH